MGAKWPLWDWSPKGASLADWVWADVDAFAIAAMMMMMLMMMEQIHPDVQCVQLKAKCPLRWGTHTPADTVTNLVGSGKMV